MKVITMYLPQYHRVPENDEWWGEGFTDWEAVKSAIPLFDGHQQPKVPLDNNYYNLLEKDVISHQADLMKQYGVDGMCIYHYWFKDGRRILEKPVENLLKWKDIDMPFCLCWANETWARSWSGVVGGNVWADQFEKESKSDKSILLEQKYGLEADWKEHFNYINQFFVDDRYIKIDGKPLILIYKCNAITRLEEMIALWRRLVRESGFPDLFVIGGDANLIPDEIIDGRLVKEPQSESGKIPVQKRNGVKTRNYDKVWESILNIPDNDSKTYYSGFVNYDDTPRRGKSGYVAYGGTPLKFERYLMRLMKKNYDNNKDITFVNAWNEWGEGMYLEPDEKNGYRYLESVNKAKTYFKNEQISSEFEGEDVNFPQISKDTIYLHSLHKWMRLRERGIKIADYFTENNYYNIAIYGYSMFAEHLIDEFKGENVNIKYIVDKEPVNSSLPLFGIHDEKPKVDAIVVCSFYYYREIYSELREACIDNIISIESIINELC